LVKHLPNDDGGTLTEDDFPVYIDSALSSWGTHQLNAGSYVVREDEMPGYAASDWGGDCDAQGNVTLAPGDEKTCEITNDDVGPTLTLVKTVINDDGGDLQVSDFQARIDGGDVDWDTAYTLSAGAHTASEVLVPGYSASVWSGDCASDGSITLGLDEDATCYITNEDLPICIDIDKTGPSLAHEGDDITYEFAVYNCGEVDLHDVTVTDPLFGWTWKKELGDLAVGELVHFDVPFTVPDPYPADVMPNTARVVGTDVLEREASDTDPHVVDILHPCIDLKKNGPTEAEVGDTITYRFKVTNCSTDTPLDNVVVRDPMFGTYFSGDPGTFHVGHLDPGQIFRFSFLYTVKQRDVPERINTAVAKGEDVLKKVVDDPDDHIVFITVGQDEPEEPQFVPEWGSIALLASGVGSLAGYARLRRRKK
jgi:uncharacterized repeat protein (TIGR01451 family)